MQLQRGIRQFEQKCTGLESGNPEDWTIVSLKRAYSPKVSYFLIFLDHSVRDLFDLAGFALPCHTGVARMAICREICLYLLCWKI